MKITFENADKVNGLLTIVIEESDYKDKVEKELKEYRKKANISGFRPGTAPMGMLRKMYGISAKMDVVNREVSNALYNYVQENKIAMLGQALPSATQTPQDLKEDVEHTFVFDIAVAPEIKVELSDKDKIDYCTIAVDDALIDQQVEMFASRSGKYEQVDEYQDNDMVKGSLTEVDGELSLDDAIVMPKYIKNEEQQKLFEGAKKGDVLTVCPRQMYEDTEMAAFLKIEKDALAEHEGAFNYQINEITRYVKAPVDQELFDNIYGPGSCKDESEFRAKIAEGLTAQLKSDSDFKFLTDARTYIENKVGELTFPTELLRRIMQEGQKDKSEAVSDEQLTASINYLKWHLIKEELVNQNNIKIEEADVKNAAVEAARVQFAQYGMNNVPAEYLEQYAENMLKEKQAVDGLVDRAIDVKLIEVLKGVVTLNQKTISLDEFNKSFND